MELAEQPPFKAAVSLSRGIHMVQQGKVIEALDAYKEAQIIDPSLKISADSCNWLCWYGTLHSHAADVLPACETAVNQKPSMKIYQDSRGLARTLTGDLLGALADFQTVLDSGIFDQAKFEGKKHRRQRWTRALKAGENPFTSNEIDELRQAEGHFGSWSK